MEHTIRIARVTLTDGSHVYDILLPAYRLSAITNQDAERAAEKIRRAIVDHCNDDAAIIHDY